MSVESEKAVAEIQNKLNELQSLSRLIGNCLSIVNETNVKGEYAGAVAEVQGWLRGFEVSVKNQREALQGMLPKTDEPKVVEAELVK